ncbi:hypothetical protein BV22DRAFT_1118861 [Leucogyrophana mollusca]|uniref:Uncharacterized protein n=1 Tax=Leucogyrophana mollusca TaxID=85980 RepID=A0ACB8BLK9_9AGAM|nr:hypothetical protein BV22DRAFT_1118861 [Leucogyrophana mollusca]
MFLSAFFQTGFGNLSSSGLIEPRSLATLRRPGPYPSCNSSPAPLRLQGNFCRRTGSYSRTTLQPTLSLLQKTFGMSLHWNHKRSIGAHVASKLLGGATLLDGNTTPAFYARQPPRSAAANLSLWGPNVPGGRLVASAPGISLCKLLFVLGSIGSAPRPSVDSVDALGTAIRTPLPVPDHDEILETARLTPLPDADLDEVLETARLTTLPLLDNEEILEWARLTPLPAPDHEEVFQSALLVVLPSPDAEEHHSWALQTPLPIADAEEEGFFDGPETEVAPTERILSNTVRRRQRKLAAKARMRAAALIDAAPAPSPTPATDISTGDRPPTRKERQRANRKLGHGAGLKIDEEAPEPGPTFADAPALDNPAAIASLYHGPRYTSARQMSPVHGPGSPSLLSPSAPQPTSAELVYALDRRIALVEANAMASENRWGQPSLSRNTSRYRPKHPLRS